MASHSVAEVIKSGAERYENHFGIFGSIFQRTEGRPPSLGGGEISLVERPQAGGVVAVPRKKDDEMAACLSVL